MAQNQNTTVALFQWYFILSVAIGYIIFVLCKSHFSVGVVFVTFTVLFCCLVFICVLPLSSLEPGEIICLQLFICIYINLSIYLYIYILEYSHVYAVPPSHSGVCILLTSRAVLV